MKPEAVLKAMSLLSPIEHDIIRETLNNTSDFRTPVI